MEYTQTARIYKLGDDFVAVTVVVAYWLPNMDVLIQILVDV